MTRAQVLASTTGAGPARPRYSLLVARDGEEVLAAQRLRYRVFAGEMGATLHTKTPGADVDAFDEHCDHLVVREDRTGEIVGCYRMLPPERVADAGTLYSETEFDLGALDGLRGALVETGRSCVHPDHRTGAVVGLVWAGHRPLPPALRPPLARRVRVGPAVRRGRARRRGVGDRAAQALRAARVPGSTAAAVAPARRAAEVALPPLLRGYLRLGAWVCGPPAHDADFDVADLFVLLGLEHVDQRYLSYFLGAS